MPDDGQPDFCQILCRRIESSLIDHTFLFQRSRHRLPPVLGMARSAQWDKHRQL